MEETIIIKKIEKCVGRFKKKNPSTRQLSHILPDK